MSFEKTQRYRNVLTTHFTEPDWENIKKSNSVRYCTGQKEICPTTKKEHWHLYLEFTKKMSLYAIKKLCNDQATHVEHRKGTQEQAIMYVQKIDTRADIHKIPFEWGEKNHQGERSDLDFLVDMIEGGATSYEILAEGKGNALRYMSLIKSGMESYWGKYGLDKEIEDGRKIIDASLQNSKNRERLIYERGNLDINTLQKRVRNLERKAANLKRAPNAPRAELILEHADLWDSDDEESDYEHE